MWHVRRRKEMRRFWLRNLIERDRLENPGVDATMIIINWMPKWQAERSVRWQAKVASACKGGNQPSSSTKWGEFIQYRETIQGLRSTELGTSCASHAVSTMKTEATSRCVTSVTICRRTGCCGLLFGDVRFESCPVRLLAYGFHWLLTGDYNHWDITASFQILSDSCITTTSHSPTAHGVIRQ